jgi:DNA-binding MarR family transcriptional regulator
VSSRSTRLDVASPAPERRRYAASRGAARGLLEALEQIDATEPPWYARAVNRTEIVDALLAAQRQVFRAVRAASAPAWLDLDLTMAQMKALRVVDEEGPATIGRLAERLGVTLPTASHLVDRLVNADLATRAEDPADRRRILARLSDRGLRLVQRLGQGPEQMREWLLEMDDADLEALLRGTRVLAGIPARRAEPARSSGRQIDQ